MFARCRAALLGACVAAMLAAAVGPAAAASPGTGAPAAPSSAAVPWAKVGAGWELVLYTNATPGKPAGTTLYLISPAGTRYSLDTWAAVAGGTPGLLAWSGDKTQALVYSASGALEQLNLVTRKLSSVDLPGQVIPIGYTLPGGQNILGVILDGAKATLARYSLTGRLLTVLATDDIYSIAGVYSANGTTLAVSAAKGLELVSNAGRVIRQLPVPGTDPLVGCTPVRWWSAGTILAECFAPATSVGRLWLVPAGGAKPTALTPQRKPSANDDSDLDAWRLTSGLYLQSQGACGTLYINKQAANGSITPVTVPGTRNTNNLIVTALGPRLLIDAKTGCPGSYSLLWFNPGTRAEQWLVKAPSNALGGVLGVVPYNSTDNAPAM